MYTPVYLQSPQLTPANCTAPAHRIPSAFTHHVTEDSRSALDSNMHITRQKPFRFTWHLLLVPCSRFSVSGVVSMSSCVILPLTVHVLKVITSSRRISNRRCLSVCLLLATLRKNFRTDWHEILREG